MQCAMCSACATQSVHRTFILFCHSKHSVSFAQCIIISICECNCSERRDTTEENEKKTRSKNSSFSAILVIHFFKSFSQKKKWRRCSKNVTWIQSANSCNRLENKEKNRKCAHYFLHWQWNQSEWFQLREKPLPSTLKSTGQNKSLSRYLNGIAMYGHSSLVFVMIVFTAFVFFSFNWNL